MNQLNERATLIFKELIKTLDENGYSKIDNTNGAYMPVVVEKIEANKYSIAHYYEVNGDLIPDPEMVFEVNGEVVTPIYYKDTYTERNYGDARFANIWMKNIKVQQGIKIPPIKRKPKDKADVYADMILNIRKEMKKRNLENNSENFQKVYEELYKVA